MTSNTAHHRVNHRTARPMLEKATLTCNAPVFDLGAHQARNLSEKGQLSVLPALRIKIRVAHRDCILPNYDQHSSHMVSRSASLGIARAVSVAPCTLLRHDVLSQILYVKRDTKRSK